MGREEEKRKKKKEEERGTILSGHRSFPFSCLEAMREYSERE